MKPRPTHGDQLVAALGVRRHYEDYYYFLGSLGRTCETVASNRAERLNDTESLTDLAMRMVYLDQNKWIDFAKAQVGKSEAQRFITTLESARKAVLAGTARFPLSRTHLIETARSPRKDQRQHLARLMTELSQGVVLRTTQRLTEEGLRHAVRRTFDLPPLSEELGPFGRGIEDGFNIDLSTKFPHRPPEFLDAFRRSLDTPDAWLDLLSYDEDAPRKAGILSTDKVATDWVAGCQEDRQILKDSDEDELRRVLAARATKHFQPALQSALGEIGRTIQEWGQLGPNRLVEFWFSIPTVRAQSEFEIAMHLEKSHKYKPNDLRDLGFLGVAIPYCDVVVAERRAIGIARARKLDQAFHTTLLTDLADLDALLEAES